jgi:hypothetical protein
MAEWCKAMESWEQLEIREEERGRRRGRSEDKKGEDWGISSSCPECAPS